MRIIDLGQGPRVGYATRVLAGYGADVIKIEPLHTGDNLRAHGPFPDDRPDPDMSGIALYLDAGKRSVCIDLQRMEGRQILHRLLLGADAVIDEIESDLADTLNLDEVTLDHCYPQLVRVAISPFGVEAAAESDDSSTPTLILEALCGWLWLSGEPGRPPARIRGEVASALAPGLYAAIGALSALEWRRAHGAGQLVEVSAQEAMLAASRFYETTYAQRSIEIGRLGPNLYPTYGYIPAANGWLALCAATAEQREMIAIMTEMAEYIDDPLFQATDESAASSAQLAQMRAWIAAREHQETFELAQQLRIPSGYVSTAEDVLQLPQILARGALQRQSTPAMVDDLVFPGAPFKMDNTPFESRAAPKLGEHTDEVLVTELNIGIEQLNAWRSQGIVA